MKYQEKIKEHLSKYKKKKFPTLKNGHWRGKEYGHILPSICGKLNLLETYRNEFLKDDLSNIKFHQGFHHLNSSQAMCINFFFPLIMDKKLEIILQTLRFNNEKVKSVEFEKESDIDNKIGQRATNFDFYIETVSGKKLYFEIKYTENEFGKAKSDNEHKKKYEQIYENAAEKTLKQAYNTCEKFLENYQIMRNLIHVDSDSYVIFVIPKDNERVYKQAVKAEDSVIEKYKNNVRILLWNDLYNIIEKQNFTGKLETHFEEFKKKYELQI